MTAAMAFGSPAVTGCLVKLTHDRSAVFVGVGHVDTRCKAAADHGECAVMDLFRTSAACQTKLASFLAERSSLVLPKDASKDTTALSPQTVGLRISRSNTSHLTNERARRTRLDSILPDPTTPEKEERHTRHHLSASDHEHVSQTSGRMSKRPHCSRMRLSSMSGVSQIPGTRTFKPASYVGGLTSSKISLSKWRSRSMSILSSRLRGWMHRARH